MFEASFHLDTEVEAKGLAVGIARVFMSRQPVSCILPCGRIVCKIGESSRTRKTTFDMGLIGLRGMEADEAE